MVDRQGTSIQERFYLFERIGTGSGSDPYRPLVPAGVNAARITMTLQNAGSNQFMAAVYSGTSTHQRLIDTGTPNGDRLWAAKVLSNRAASDSSVRVLTVATASSSQTVFNTGI